MNDRSDKHRRPDSRVIVIRGAREHNLKNVDVEIPRDRLVVFTGLSGSGKSSLAFDTIYAEGQRRYVESLSAYARQFLEMMQKPDVDQIDGLSPAISIEQKTTSRNPRSTVGTVTEIYDYMRLLWAGGGAVGRIQYDYLLTAPATFDTQALTASETRWGWTVGGGLEWAFATNWSVKGEYLFMDLGDSDVFRTIPAGRAANLPTSFTVAFDDNQFHLVRLGLNYRFGNFGLVP